MLINQIMQIVKIHYILLKYLRLSADNFLEDFKYIEKLNIL